MALDDILRNGVGIANTVTAGVQAAVTWEAWIGRDIKGKPSYAAPVTLRAIIDLNRKQRYLDGRVQTVVATLTILEPVTPNNTAGRQGVIDVRDRFILPDGSSGPIMTAPNAVWDPGAARPFLNEVYI